MLSQKSDDFKINLNLDDCFNILDHVLIVSSEIFWKLLKDPNVKSEESDDGNLFSRI